MFKDFKRHENGKRKKETKKEKFCSFRFGIVLISFSRLYFANTCQYDSVMVEIHDEIFSRVFNPEMSVKGGFVDRYMCDDIGAKIVVEDDTIRTGTLYYLMFIPERL